jgi:uncharacterized protein
MGKDKTIAGRKDVTVVSSRTIFPGKENEYNEFVHRMVAAASAAPGNLGITTLIPQKGKSGLYHIVLRFKDQAAVDAWENSDIRKQLTMEADKFSRHERQAATGVEAWFTIPECPQVNVPPHWKQVIVTTIGVFVMSTIFIKMFVFLNFGLNFYVENLIISALVVISLTFATMPFLNRIVFRKWLYK